VKSIGEGINGITQSVAGSFNSATADINKSISSGVKSAIDGVKSMFSSETKAVNESINGTDTTSGTSVEKPVEGVDRMTS
jgi:phage-related protein